MPLFGPSLAVRELQQAIGDDNFKHLKEHGFYVVESGGRRFALNTAGILAVDAPDRESWYTLCVSPIKTGEENVPTEDLGIMMYRWVQANPARVLEVANRTRTIPGRDFDYKGSLSRPAPEANYNQPRIGTSDTCLRNDLPVDYIQRLRGDLVSAVTARLSHDVCRRPEYLVVRDIRPRDMGLCAWGEEAEWPCESTRQLGMQDGRYVCIYGLAVNPAQGRVMSVRFVVMGNTCVEWDLSLLYIPRTIVEVDGRRELHYSPIGYSRCAVVIPSNSVYEIRIASLEPAPVTPVGFVVEERGRTIAP